MITTQQFRPILIGVEFEGLYIWQRINWSWVLQRIPMLLFALVSSYGVGHLLHISDVPFPFDYLGAVSFDVGFLGAISLADMQLKKNILSTIAYYGLNIVMSGLGALFNILSHAGGKYENINAEAITVGAPFALVGLMFALFYHSIMSRYIEKEIEQQEDEKKTLQLTAFPCDYCGEGFPKPAAKYGHYRSCTMKAMHARNPDPIVCKCLRCHPKA